MSIYVTFICYIEGFYNVTRQIIWKFLRDRSCPQLQNAKQILYKGTTIKIQVIKYVQMYDWH
jgi:hypothetical protein